uniref:NADH:ubiquinone reductase (H(+)-translocating) n=1 Tax=Blastopsylla occidentalis TaxID=121832 RepID=A0A2U9QJL3_BLAOC|nr:NADH dehydrogenase subunit 5 [Blastopsylla occidentalis]AWU48864.1 NADH dehydrogenase subunit 5 [Blastopsylla occidentalis]
MNLNSKFSYICFFMLMSSSLILLFLLKIIFYNITYMLEFEMMFFNSVSFCFIIFIDWMSLTFSLTVILISSLILIYGNEYMGKNCYQFLWLTILFILFMIIMIYSPSILGVILGWDGLGLISYCLVIYYNSTDAFNSGFITAASNRLGDSMLIMSIIWFSFKGMYLFYENLSLGFLYFFMACLTKSAQIPFSAWLPAAMAAPTPISSLVHSSTLVTAGVYMLIRFYNMLINADLNIILLVISILTIIMAGLTSFFENDMKRIIALSTLGQLGFMMMILAVGYTSVAFFHLLIHALFKALLFMCAGAMIHSGMSMQDTRKMGNLKIDFFLKLSLSISSYCLMGLPFTSGFYSKDFLLELSLMSYPGIGIGLMMILSALITVSYSVRLMKLISSSNYWIVWIPSSKYLLVPIFTLTLMNVFGGCILNWLIMNELNLILINTIYKISPLVMIMTGLIWQGLLPINSIMCFFLSNMMFISILTKNMSKSVMLMFFNLKVMDQGWFEMIFMQMKYMFIYKSFFMKSITTYLNYLPLLSLILIMILFI